MAWSSSRDIISTGPELTELLESLGFIDDVFGGSFDTTRWVQVHVVGDYFPSTGQGRALPSYTTTWLWHCMTLCVRGSNLALVPAGNRLTALISSWRSSSFQPLVTPLPALAFSELRAACCVLTSASRSRCSCAFTSCTYTHTHSETLIRFMCTVEARGLHTHIG